MKDFFAIYPFIKQPDLMFPYINIKSLLAISLSNLVIIIGLIYRAKRMDTIK